MNDRNGNGENVEGGRFGRKFVTYTKIVEVSRKRTRKETTLDEH